MAFIPAPCKVDTAECLNPLRFRQVAETSGKLIYRVVARAQPHIDPRIAERLLFSFADVAAYEPVGLCQEDQVAKGCRGPKFVSIELPDRTRSVDNQYSVTLSEECGKHWFSA